MSNFTEVIGLTLAWRNIRRPKAALGVAPGMMRQKRDFRWPVSMSRQVIEAKILQANGPMVFSLDWSASPTRVGMSSGQITIPFNFFLFF